MLANTIAIIVLTLIVLGPGSCLLQLGWRRGGILRTLTVAALLGMLTLMPWLFLPWGPGASPEDRIVQFVGAWGILFIVIGLAFAAVSLFGSVRNRGRSDRDR
jgi:hypothetical protein